MNRSAGLPAAARSRTVAIVAVASAVLWLGTRGTASQQPAPAASRPNIVLMFPDNLGWGEVNVYGGVRGPITPRLDRMAADIFERGERIADGMLARHEAYFGAVH